MWFPTQKGIVRVDTNNIETKHKPLTAFVDTVYAANQLQKNNSSITLNDPDNRQLDISLHTIALGQSDCAHYRYRSDPSTAWNDLRDSNKIIFDSLSAGNHTLQFQAARFSGWNGPITELKVQVNPKLIETLWFKFILLALLILGLAIWAARLNKGKLKLEIQVGKRTQELSQALNVISDQKDTIKEEAKRKQRHFLDLSHELRTPLTLVLTPLHTDAPIIDETRRLMKRNGDRLLNLVNQMLKLEQLDVFDESPDQKEVNLASRCKLALEQFKHKAETKHIQLSSDLPHEETYIHGSESEVDTLLVNLISNAMKFTPQGGHIHLSFSTANQQCALSIEDSGPGVPMAERARIFQRFVRLNQEITEGNGLGLAIVKHIIQRHHGEIQVGDSDLGGARFSVTLPITRQANIQDVATQTPNSQQLILAIDDNADILMLIESILSPHYQVISSQIPAEAITIAQRRVPDLIVTDVGMPDMDGFELVRALRQHRDTKDIPVIFATARSHPKDQVTALEAGGDAFLTKPFMPEQLLAYVNRFMTTKQATSTAEAEIKKDVSLLTRAKQIINNHMTNPDFSIDELAQELAMSRSAMYRNFKEEADLLPAEFIKRCRLEHASELLKNTKLSVSKVASLSGYNQAATFTRNFKKHFGHSPKEHR